jgi:heme A synthase
MARAWLRRLAVLAAVCTLLLVIAGSTGYQSMHRTIAAPVGVLNIILAIGLQLVEPRAWMRRFAWGAALTVAAQIALGILVARGTLPLSAFVVHAVFAEVCFALIAAVAAGQVFGIPGFAGWATRGPAPAIAVTALVAQAVLGATVRHGISGPLPHIGGAALATVLVMWAALQVLNRHMENPRLRRAAMLLLSLTFSQVFLGLGSYLANAAGTPGEGPVLAWFAAAHVVVGLTTIGFAVMLMVLVYGDARLAEADAALGGVAVA